MSVLIRDMNIPKNCSTCPFCICDEEDWCVVLREYISHHEYCPLVEVKTPHGRLIDADKFCDEMKDKQHNCAEWRSETEDDDIKNHAQGALTAFIECKLTMDKMPTIIEAEE